MAMRTETLGEFEQSIMLAILHLEDGAYGVTIRREMERRLEREIVVGALYTTLERLERKGYVRSAMSAPTPERGGRAKRLFTIRAAGVSALRDSRERHDRMWHGLSASLKRMS